VRLIRLGALVGSVVLLVATTVSMVNKRAEQRAEQNARVVATVLMADQAVDSTIVRAMAVADVAGAATDPASMIRTFEEGVEACVTSPAADRCTGPDISASTAYGDAVRASVENQGPAVAIDEATGSLLVVSRGEVTSALYLPAQSLVGPVAAAVVDGNDAVVDLVLSSDPIGPGTSDLARTGPTTIDGRLVVADTLPLPGDGGSMRVTVSIPDEAGLFGDGFALYVVLLALGTVLMGLAGWTFLLDRRSLERQATTDDLTGLPNRREFERLADEALLAAERFNTGLCVMLIDLNGFKQINDTLGHQFGDLVLRAAAKRLRQAVRDTDVVGRWGGDEFVILLPGLQDSSAVRSSAERIGALLGDTPIAGEVTVTAAIGAALFPRHGTTLNDLVRAADEAMYGAKTTGVTHRLADALSSDLGREATSTRYGGPDRRRVHLKDSDRV
jgi:diguanylate cyclase (GGDEF)-like protein